MSVSSLFQPALSSPVGADSGYSVGGFVGAGVLLRRSGGLPGNGGCNTVGEGVLYLFHRSRRTVDATPGKRFLQVKIFEQRSVWEQPVRARP
jgi:hypothetical protein